MVKLYLLLYVDDVIIIGDENYINYLVSIFQTEYIDKLLERFNMADYNAADIPIQPSLKFDTKIKPDNLSKYPFRELVGCLNCLMLPIRTCHILLISSTDFKKIQLKKLLSS